jgi:hypothetical protein
MPLHTYSVLLPPGLPPDSFSLQMDDDNLLFNPDDIWGLAEEQDFTKNIEFD